MQDILSEGPAPRVLGIVQDILSGGSATRVACRILCLWYCGPAGCCYVIQVFFY